ncbi:MAG: cation efflux system (czcB-like) [Candidatus Sericytochromatia bacterium]|nr:MAG: cation efflux system (czcB-like) [Candidatus Sericytochromatia bacterium]
MKLYKFLSLFFILILSCSRNEVKQEEKNVIDSNIIQISQNSPILKEIKSEYPKEKYFQEEIKVTGIIKNYENSVSNIISPVSGKIIYENIQIGKYVKKGELIAKIQNNEVAKIFAEYIHQYHNNEVLINQAKIKLKLAEENYKREKRLYEEGISSKKDFLQAENEYLLLKEEIRGLNEHNTHLKNETEALLKTYNITLPKDNRFENVNSIIEIRANKSGVFTKKNIILDSNISANDSICEITDNSVLYAQLNIISDDITKISLNDPVEILVNSNKVLSKIDYIEPSINKEEQVFIARAKINNKENILKSNLFVNAIIKTQKNNKKYIFLDNNCISNIENNYFVFIDKGNNSFEKKEVKIKENKNNGFYIQNSLEKNQKVVCKGNFYLKSQLLKSNLEEE